jgi:LL-diaminopimelate aminotransferase
MLDTLGIAVTPGPSYGAQGEGYFRMSLTVPDDQVELACDRLRAFDAGKAVASLAGSSSTA